MRLALSFVLCTALLSLAVPGAASPQTAWYSDQPDRMFWFIVVADSHIGCQWSCGDSDTEGLDWVTGEAFQVIQPRLVVVCGDLTDATGGGLIPNVQYDEEWSAYRDIVLSNGLSEANYLDLPGNHDQYNDPGLPHYLEYSIQGSADGYTQHSFVVDEWFGTYHFLAVATTDIDGAGVFSDKATLDKWEMDFIQESLDLNADADLHFAFGHHGVKYGSSNKVGTGGPEFLEELKSHKVSAYFWGHTHDYYSENHDGTLFHNTRSLAKSGDSNFTLAVVDHNGLSVRTFEARKWPYLLISAPVDPLLGGNNPYTYPVPGGWSQAPVRAVVFSKNTPDSVVFRIDGGDWQPMDLVSPSTYQGTFDATQLEPGPHQLRVRANPWTEVDHEIAFKVVTGVECSNGIDDDEDGWTDFPADPGCINPADPDETDPPPLPEPDPEPVPDEPPETTPDEPGEDQTVALPDAEDLPPVEVPEESNPEPAVEFLPEAVVETASPEIVSEEGSMAEDIEVPSGTDTIGLPEVGMDGVGAVGGGCRITSTSDPRSFAALAACMALLLVAASRRRRKA